MQHFRYLLLPAVVFLGSCSLPNLPAAHLPQYRPQGEQRVEQALAELQAEAVGIGVSSSVTNGTATTALTIDIQNAEGLLASRDLAPRIRQLAGRVVQILANPQEYQTVEVNVEETNNYVVASTNQQQQFQYTLQELQ
jgi:hypothetical protein